MKPDRYLPELADTAQRALGLSPRPNQLEGARLLARGALLVELATGEGKTLMAALAAARLVAAGKKVHIHTPNDYLARRDAEWMRPFFAAAGLSVASLQTDTPTADRQQIYQYDVVYGTPAVFCFDYLRDRLALDPSTVAHPVQNLKGFAAIVDEADAVLLDMGRTPYTFTQPVAPASDLYQMAAEFTRGLEGIPAEQTRAKPSLVRGIGEAKVEVPDVDYVFDPDLRTAWLLERGFDRLEVFLRERGMAGREVSFYAVVVATLRSRFFERDVKYLVRNGALLHVDESTGRPAEGRFLGEGVQQALETREGLPLSPDTVTLASVTLQDYLSQYGSLSGMTGTAWADRQEFEELYGLDVKRLAPHRPCIREDAPDVVLAAAAERLDAVLADILASHEKRQPVLVGATRIEDAERIHAALAARGISAELLTAKDFAREDAALERAGEPGAITVTASLAGRGADIVLGGKHSGPDAREQVLAVGGLRVIGVERSLLSRADAQLRGRAGRQGEPGQSVFYLSLQDELFRGVSAERLAALLPLARAGLPLLGRLVSNMVASLQRRSNGADSTVRVMLVRADAGLRAARSAYYAWRQELLLDEGAALRFLSGQGIELTANMSRFAAVSAVLRETDQAWQAYLAGDDTRKVGAWMRAHLGKTGQRDSSAESLAEFEQRMSDAFSRAAATLNRTPEA